jgi:hypothetical protein
VEPLPTDPIYTFQMIFRSAVMWLLLLALPLQGFAAATMLNCGPNHHQMWKASVATQAVAHEHSGHGDHHHPMGSADLDATSASSEPGDDGSPVQHLGKLTKFKCSACAACCMGAALPATALTFQSPPPAEPPDFSVLASHVGFLTDGPDRPPRHPLV